jgi:hypothetical protein
MVESAHREGGRRSGRPIRDRRQSERGAAPRAHRSIGSSLFCGGLAGAFGTAAMDTLLYVRYRRGGGTQGPLEWEFSAAVDKWEDVSAPGLVGKRVIEEVLGHDVPDRWARSTQNLVHWATGMGWGAPFGVVIGSARRRSWAWGLDLGPIVWLAGYVVLPAAKIYQPIWDYDTKTLAKDLSAHLVYGVTTGTVFAALASRISW